MEDIDIEAARERYLKAAYWPWPIAFAYCQSSEVRERAVDAAIQQLEVARSEFACSCALKMSHLAITGREPQSVERVAADGEPWEVKSPDQVYWEELAELEVALVDSIKVGQIDTWGRKRPERSLEKLQPTDWVGTEIDPGETCDLVRAGWREQRYSLSAALVEVERESIAFDIHLFGAAVRQLAEAHDSRVTDSIGPIFHDWRESDLKPKEGYWSVFVTGAWIASRSDQFVAAVQEYERQAYLSRGGCHSADGWKFLGNLMSEQFSMTLTDTTDRLREALENGKLHQGIGHEVNAIPRPIERHEWTGWQVAHDQHGMSVLTGVYDVKWPAEEVRKAFPADDTKKEELRPSHPDPTNEEILARCDELHAKGMWVRDIAAQLPREAKFSGVKHVTIRELTHGRYKRTGRRGIATKK